jgi:hypothetical protein
MDIEKYNLTEKYDFIVEENSDKQVSYFFDSTGIKGIIKKVVIFQTKNGFVYQMGLGNVIEKTKEPDFKTISDNGDIKKIIATTIWCAMDFMNNNPNIVIGFTGNETRKTKLYQRIIASYLDYFLQYFEVYGVLSLSEMEIFNPQIEYFGFYFKHKKQ